MLSNTPFIKRRRTTLTTCTFELPHTTESKDKRKVHRPDFFLNVPPATSTPGENWESEHGFEPYERGWVAVKHTSDRHWYTVDGSVSITHYHKAKILVQVHDGCDEVALGIDQRLKREDVDGATIIYQNAAGTGWLFAHATEEEHHDRILLGETAISVVFEELLMNRLIRMDVVDIAGRSTSNRRGELTILGHINSFRNDCMKMARYLEGQLYVGEHVKNPEDHYIYKMIEKAYALTVKKWKAEKSAEYNQISDRIAPIEKRLKSRHSFKRRWEIPTIFPNAERTETPENE